jgi:hypothetical protein
LMVLKSDVKQVFLVLSVKDKTEIIIQFNPERFLYQFDSDTGAKHFLL